eukprot:TRINITY_DN7436_c0_g1_i1.p1 TRINITY_DN7436_c0_g1~~TRINITY_DN7436_c0_g1_i1.p1  ORF type:complete len:290 (+),score=14.03 TRINITY_DN7436_c0_g1_i1:274-1143(+)
MSGIIGGFAAITASCITHPADSIKVRMFLHGELEANNAPKLALIRKIYQTEGLRRGFYRGLSATILRQALFSTSRFTVNDSIQAALGGKDNITALSKAISAAIAGTIGAMVSCPADLVLVRMQADGKLPSYMQRRYRNVFDGIKRIAKEEGPLSLYRGLKPLLTRGMAVTSGQFTSYDVAKRTLGDLGFDKNKTSSHLIASLFAGCVSTLIVNPMDVIKSRMMQSSVKADGNIVKAYSTDWHCVAHTYSVEGFRGFYKGLVPCFFRQCPQVVLMWCIYEQYSNLWKRLW